MAPPALVAAVLVAAGAVAGAVGTAGGITSLVTYPVLLAVGLSPRAADVANLVALVACWPGSALASRAELTGTRRWLACALPVAAVGAAAGSVLLLTTPPGVFARVVPFLVLAGSAALLAQPALAARRPPVHRGGGALVLVLVGVLSVYGGYFGAGGGVMTLALLLLLLDPDLSRANAAKNMLVGAGAVASAALFVAAGPVDWTAVVPLAFGLLAGSVVGPVLARRLPARSVRWAAAVLGVVLAVVLWVRPG